MVCSYLLLARDSVILQRCTGMGCSFIYFTFNDAIGCSMFCAYVMLIRQFPEEWRFNMKIFQLLNKLIILPFFVNQCTKFHKPFVSCGKKEKENCGLGIGWDLSADIRTGLL